jgi:hypothetical protein
MPLVNQKAVFDDEVFYIPRLTSQEGVGKRPLSLEFSHRVLHFANASDLDHKLGEC